jgi:hypothetical protein
MPRVGDEAFEQWYSTVVPGTFRTVHRKDPVPHLPTMNMGFHHMPYEVRSLLLINSAQISPPDNMHVILCFIRIIYSRHSFVLLWLVCGRCFTRRTIPSGRSAPSRERTTPALTNTPWMVTYVSDERITSMVPFSCIRTLLKRSIFIYQTALVCYITCCVVSCP